MQSMHFCTADRDDNAFGDRGGHLFVRATGEPVKTKQKFWPFTEHTFCVRCIAKMSHSDQEYLRKNGHAKEVKAARGVEII